MTTFPANAPRPFFDDDIGRLEDDPDVLEDQDPLVTAAVPPAGWVQHPDSAQQHFNDPRVRWGDRQVLDLVPIIASGTPDTKVTKDLVQFESHTPRVCMIRLSSVQVTGNAAPSANILATWTVYIGVGSAAQSKKFQQQVAPQNGSAQTDIVLTFPVQVCRITCSVTAQPAAGSPVDVECVAHLAPFTPNPHVETER